jgi:hypothetical protein
MEKRKSAYFLVVSAIVLLMAISSVSAGFGDWWKALTGRATDQYVTLNITVGVPQIIYVWNQSTTFINILEAPSSTSFLINFTVYIPSGTPNLNDSTSYANISRSGETTRTSPACTRTAIWASNFANYSCNITAWWWDGNGTWNIGAYIQDNYTNGVSNTSVTQALDDNLGFLASPSALTWAGIAAGATNQTSNNDPLVLNNTGNVPVNVGNIQVNSTNLRGESDSSLALWAKNFTVSPNNGGTPPAECGGTAMNNKTLVGVAIANLTKGNFTVNDGTAQEQLYFCLKIAGAELTTQAYSTANESMWGVKIV